MMPDVSSILSANGVSHVVVAAITHMTDQQLADAVGYMITCYKNTDADKLSKGIEDWYNENDPQPDLKHWGYYMGKEFKRYLSRGLVSAMQDCVGDDSDNELRAFAHGLNKAGGAWISDEEMARHMEYLAWCFRCLSTSDFTNKYVTSYGSEFSDEAKRLATDIFHGSSESQRNCRIVEVAATLVEDNEGYARFIHAINP